MRWQKLGLVYRPSGSIPWMKSHAANPVADWIGDDLYRIYFSARDDKNRSCVSWVEIDLKDPCRVLRVASEPALLPGRRGTFDDSGCSMGCIVREGTRRLLYYMGWNLAQTVPWRNSIGLAVSEDGEKFERVSLAPIVDRSDADPYTLSYPWVLRDGAEYTMWYGSNRDWDGTSTDMCHVIKRATSSDGRCWIRDGQPLIYSDESQGQSFARPCVVRDAEGFRMWYAYRGDYYRIGYAESDDGIQWIRKDLDVGIDVSASGWDSESLCYPSVFDHNGGRYMLYCGNGYGLTGFGIAVAK